jgi:Gly-Xaa carboxypeptidase
MIAHCFLQLYTVNALPEVVTTYINHRIAPHQRVADVEAHIARLVLPLAQKYALNFTQHIHDEDVPIAIPSKGHAVGRVTLRPAVGPLEPSPISPLGNGAWNVLAGSIRHALKAPVRPGEEPQDGERKSVVVAPILMPANTDTRHYWGLSKNLYRFHPVFVTEGVHTVNERVSIQAYVDAVTFFHELIRNYDEAKDV